MLSRQVLQNIASIEQDKGTAMHAYKRIFIDKGAHCPCYMRVAKQIRKLEIPVNWARMVSLSFFRGITEKHSKISKSHESGLCKLELCAFNLCIL